MDKTTYSNLDIEAILEVSLFSFAYWYREAKGSEKLDEFISKYSLAMHNAFPEDAMLINNHMKELGELSAEIDKQRG